MLQTMEKVLEVDTEGIVRFVWDDSLAEMMREGTGKIERASYIEPDGAGWFVDLSPVGGPVRRGFSLRCEAIAFELDWIRKNLGL